MHIVFAASECVPWAKTGGLADVVGTLPPVLVRMGHRVTTFLPYYRFVARRLPDLPTVIEASKILGGPDVFHAHDWQAALVPIYLRSLYFFDPVLRKVPCVFTVHNAGYQGWFPADTMPRLLLPWDMFTVDGLEAHNQLNLLKGALVYADALTTVSRRYAEELQTSEFGNGLEDIFRRRKDDLYGIPNGVDYDEWDPTRDANIAAHYSADNLKGKQECRRDLLHAFGLDSVEDHTAVLGIASRFATQKGFDLLAGIIPELVKDDIVLIAFGTGEEYYERLFSELAARYPDKLRVQIKYDETMAHKIEAGSDIFLMPSRYEPGGLNQMYSLRYGTVPVARATGGLEDTIYELPEGQGNGFKFHTYNQWDLLDAIRRAVATFANKPQWEAMMKRGMEQDFSWDKPAEEYVKVYQAVIERRAWS